MSNNVESSVSSSTGESSKMQTDSTADPSNPSAQEPKNVQELTNYIQNMLQQMQVLYLARDA